MIGSTVKGIRDTYRLVERMKGTGSNFVGSHNAQDRKVIKLYHFGKEENFQRFILERNALQQLSHPNIVELYDIHDKNEDNIFLALEYVHGTDLETVLRQRGPISAQDARVIFAPLCDALTYMHDNELFHHDVKPANILLRDDKTPILADLGFACNEDTNEFEPEALFGTARYMSPERWHAKMDPRADIYALGATLYEMLTGVPAYVGASTTSVMNGHFAGALPNASERNETIPSDLSEVVMTAMQKKPKNRYQTAQEFKKALLKTGKRSIFSRLGDFGRYTSSFIL